MLYSKFVAAEDSKSRRLMVVLHGLGDTLEGFRWLPKAMDLPWLNYLLVNAPDSYYGGYSWFDINNPDPGVVRSRQLLFELLGELHHQCFPPELITLGGFSQGCLMTVEAGVRYPHRLAGLVGISGWVHNLEQLLAEMPAAGPTQRLLMTHGTADPVVPIGLVRPQIPLLQAVKINVTWQEFAKAHTIAGEEELCLIREFVSAGYPA